MTSKIVLIGGTPGVGKTSVGQKLANRLEGSFLDLSQFANQGELILSRDRVRNTKIIDPEKVQSYVTEWINKQSGWIIIVGHYIDLLDLPNIKLVIILRTTPSVLRMRLAQKKWIPPKILENIQAEVLGVCINDALNQFPKKTIIELDTSHSSIDSVAENIAQLLTSSQEQLTKYTKQHFDWLGHLTNDELKDIFPE